MLEYSKKTEDKFPAGTSHDMFTADIKWSIFQLIIIYFFFWFNKLNV